MTDRLYKNKINIQRQNEPKDPKNNLQSIFTNKVQMFEPKSSLLGKITQRNNIDHDYNDEIDEEQKTIERKPKLMKINEKPEERFKLSANKSSKWEQIVSDDEDPIVNNFLLGKDEKITKCIELLEYLRQNSINF